MIVEGRGEETIEDEDDDEDENENGLVLTYSLNRFKLR
jgi:hypothetical protein